MSPGLGKKCIEQIYNTLGEGMDMDQARTHSILGQIKIIFHKFDFFSFQIRCILFDIGTLGLARRGSTAVILLDVRWRCFSRLKLSQQLPEVVAPPL